MVSSWGGGWLVGGLKGGGGVEVEGQALSGRGVEWRECERMR